jgi:hypothetical protein
MKILWLLCMLFTILYIALTGYIYIYIYICSLVNALGYMIYLLK